jgi:hypothetical protein
VETCLIVTRGDKTQPRLSRIHASQKASRFLRNVIRTDAALLADKLEAYVVSEAADVGKWHHFRNYTPEDRFCRHTPTTSGEDETERANQDCKGSHPQRSW